jgi:hypothetical protein
MSGIVKSERRKEFAKYKDLSKFFKSCAKNPSKAPQETAEQKAEREKRQAQLAAKKLANYGAAAAAQPPMKEIPTGSPYQAALEAWKSSENKGTFDHWTSSN